MNGISIEVHGLTLEQALYMQAVVMPEFYALLEKHKEPLEELGGVYVRKV